MNRETIPAMALASILCFLLCAGEASAQQRERQHILFSLTEDMDKSGTEYDGSAQNSWIRNVSAPVRAGMTAFKHYVNTNHYRSEFNSPRVEAGGTYWYGWATYLPEGFLYHGVSTIIMQMAAWPTERFFPAGGIGHKMVVDRGHHAGELLFTLHYPGRYGETRYIQPRLGHVEAMLGVWTDFVMHARWTTGTDGFVRLWMQCDGGGFDLVLDYEGPTWFDDANRGRSPGGPYFKMGAYFGGSGWGEPGSVQRLYTDEFRLGAAEARFHHVAPGNEPIVIRPAPLRVQLHSPRPYEVLQGEVPVHFSMRNLPDTSQVEDVTVLVGRDTLYHGPAVAQPFVIDTEALAEGLQRLKVTARASGGHVAAAEIELMVRNQLLGDCGTGGLIAYYPMTEGQGEVIHDRSGCAEPLDLQMYAPEEVHWLEGRNGLRFSGQQYGALVSGGPAAKLHNAILQTGQFSLELWIETDNTDQRGPARIFQYGNQHGSANLMFGQNAANMQTRLHMGPSGRTYLNAGDVHPAETHFVLVHDGTELRLYENGMLTGSQESMADMNAWDASFFLTLANDAPPRRLRPWKGTLYLAAIYNRALEVDEIRQRFESGNRR